MALLKKKEKPVKATKKAASSSMDMSAAKDAISEKKTSGYNVIQKRKISRVQIGLIVLSILFLVISLVATWIINRQRDNYLNELNGGIQQFQNEIAVLNTSRGVQEQTSKANRVLYDTYQHETDDIRMKEILSEILLWEGEEGFGSRPQKAVEVQSTYQLTEDASFIESLFFPEAYYMGVRYQQITSTSRKEEKYDPLMEFESYCTQVVSGGARSYQAVVKVMFYGQDDQPYTKRILLGYTVYDKGLVANLEAHDLLISE